MSAAPRIGRCPQCGSPATLETSNAFRPFCSERCKMLDFGAWINGQYTIPAVENDLDGEEIELPDDPRDRLQ